MKFTFLTGDVNWQDYGGLWISPKQHGEFDYWFVRELLNWENAVGEREANEIGSKYNCSLAMVAPGQLSPQELARIKESLGCDPEQWELAEHKGYLDAMLVEACYSYGVRVPVWDANGSNYQKLFSECSKQAEFGEMLSGFVLDRPVNRIGTSGWDAIKGNITAGLRSNDSPEAQLMRKIGGAQ